MTNTPREQLKQPLIDLFAAGRLYGQKTVPREKWEREISMALDATLAVIKGLPAMQEEEPTENKIHTERIVTSSQRLMVSEFQVAPTFEADGHEYAKGPRNELRRQILAELEDKSNE